MTRYWIGVASCEHVQRGTQDGFAQVCHGKIGTLKSMSEGDWLIYYSPTYSFGGKEACRCFTAIGTVDKGDPYTFELYEGFIPWRRNVTFLKSKEAPIELLLESLTFIKDKKKWGFPFRRGSFEISRSDFELIAKNMGALG
ncbi:MAG TPA: EVE domain-containing protein [Parachlamydiaceae bacterium]|nr:EVE domain-containing protein [Parachlamydiaceae bacterium]